MNKILIFFTNIYLSTSNQFPLKKEDSDSITLALQYLKNYPETRAKLSAKEFTILKNSKENASLFKQAFGCSSDHLSFEQLQIDLLAEKTLETWALEDLNHLIAATKIKNYLKIHRYSSREFVKLRHKMGALNWIFSGRTLSLENIAIEELPDIWNHSSFIQNLTDLDLSGNRLETLPPSFSKLSSLTRLSLSHNHFTIFPESLPPLFNLDLSFNHLRTFPNSLKPFYRKPEILRSRDLNVSFNHIEVLPDAFHQIQLLNVSNNFLKNLPNYFKNYKYISESQLLELCTWTIDEIDGFNISPLLQRINLRGCEDTTEVPKERVFVFESWDFYPLTRILSVDIETKPLELANLLIKGPLAMRKLKEIAQKKAESLVNYDFNTIYSSYLVLLKEDLDLLVKIEDIPSIPSDVLTPKDLEIAKGSLLDFFKNKEAIYQQLSQEKIWKQALKPAYFIENHVELYHPNEQVCLYLTQKILG